MNLQEIEKNIKESYQGTEKNVSCKRLAEQILPFFRTICGEKKTAEDWLKIVYRYCVSVYFPENFSTDDWSEGRKEACRLYLDILESLLEEEKQHRDFDRCRDFELLTERELEKSAIRTEYENFCRTLKELKVYEFMRVAAECTPFDTLGHIAGVHYTAMHIARQISAYTEIKIDPGLISAAAIVHDIGKFGCREEEAGRVPYLHYYYTQKFTDRFHMERIGHTAANHSTWDLELENLSIENLLLIYADFRVKSIRENGKEKICFWSLDESYRIILSKLDNVDEVKAKRYEKVFMKLKDFEEFLEEAGVNPDLEGEFIQNVQKKTAEEVVFFNRKETAECFRHKAVGSNLMIMNTFSNSRSFVSLLEEANGEKDWRNVRSYLNVLDEYSAYLSCSQKERILDFLYEMLMNKDGDIRRQAAGIMGKMIAQYEVKYQKEVPQGAPVFTQKKTALELWNSVLNSILVTDHKITQQHRRWIGYALKTVFHSLMERISPKEKTVFLETLLGYYTVEQWDELTLFILTDCALEIQISECTKMQQKILTDFMDRVYVQGDYECRIAVLRFWTKWLEDGWEKKTKTEIFQGQNSSLCSRYLIEKIQNRLNGKNEKEFVLEENELIELFQKNQKMETPWIEKAVNLEILNDYYKKNKKTECFQLAAHLVHMLQNSDRIVIRRQAGDYLTNLIEFLSLDQRYEIAAELMKGLEIGEYSASRYIPEYFGRIFYSLGISAQEEIVAKFREMIDGKNYKVAVMALETVGIAAQFLYLMRDKKTEDNGYFEVRKQQLEGLLLRGMAHYRDETRQEAFYIVGHSIFGSSRLSLKEKGEYFCSTGKKVLSLMKQEQVAFYLYNNAAALNHIYRFLLEYRVTYGEFNERYAQKTAFFPGTFDPFSRGHKAVVEEILKHDMEVYLALDEFSWSKKTQPYKIRRKIVEMSVADLKNVYLFPSKIPVNIANPESLRELKKVMKGQKLFIVVGSDVVMNASAYRKQPQKDSIHEFDHIVMQRNTRKSESKALIREKINGEIVWLDIKEKGENISSTRIRENIDKNRDISNLVEHNVQNYIYEKSLYVREPMYRQMTGSRPVTTGIYEQIPADIYEELQLGLLKEHEMPENESAVLIRNEKKYGRIEGVVLFHQIFVSELYRECRDEEITAWFRKNISGRICVLTGIYYQKENVTEDNCQAVFMETMAHFVENEISYVLCRKTQENGEFLKRQGFVEGIGEWLLCDVRRPLVFFADMPLTLKEPFAGNAKIREKIVECRKKLQNALTLLYPGKLVLTMDSYIINYKLVSRIAQENKRSLFQMEKKNWGEKMCVPFGKIMKGTQVPNTVTKELNTEKIYSGDMHRFVIKEYPDYADLEVQLRTIKAFGRPVILVDNLFHKSYRMDFITPYLEKEKMAIDKILVSVMTGPGRDIAQMRQWDVECLYFIPNMRTWFIESDFYPFIGGDTMEKKNTDTILLPSVNPILPYHVPPFLKGIEAASFYELSRVCLENTFEILRVLEREYQKLIGRKLTLERLGEALSQSRCPDVNTGIFYKMNESPSVYVKYELERLTRMDTFARYGREKGE